MLSGSRHGARRHLVSPLIIRQRKLLMKASRAAPPVKKVHCCDLRPSPILTTCFADMKVQVKIPTETRAMEVYFDMLYLRGGEERCQGPSPALQSSFPSPLLGVLLHYTSTNLGKLAFIQYLTLDFAGDRRPTYPNCTRKSSFWTKVSLSVAKNPCTSSHKHGYFRSQGSLTLFFLHSGFSCCALCYMAQNIPLAIWGQLS